jgi:hypothetical protein
MRKEAKIIGRLSLDTENIVLPRTPILHSTTKVCLALPDAPSMRASAG